MSSRETDSRQELSDDLSAELLAGVGVGKLVKLICQRPTCSVSRSEWRDFARDNKIDPNVVKHGIESGDLVSFDGHLVPARYIKIEQRLNRYYNSNAFEPIVVPADSLMTFGQKMAIANMRKSGIHILTGGPGTGKSYLISKIISYLEEEGVSFCVATPTGKAAMTITERAGVRVVTIHSLLGVKGTDPMIEHGTAPRSRFDVLIIDEASMMDSIMMIRVLDAAAAASKSILIVGDANQLPPVGHGSPFAFMCSRKMAGINVSKLDEVKRQADGNDIPLACKELLETGRIAGSYRNVTVANSLTEYIESASLKKCIILGGTNQNVDSYNSQAHRMATRETDEYPVVCLKNDWDLNVANGMCGTLRGDEIRFGDNIVSPNEVKWAYAYALTVHKSQGSEWHNVVVAVDKFFDRKMLYTAMSRARHHVVLFGNVYGEFQIRSSRYLPREVANETLG